PSTSLSDLYAYGSSTGSASGHPVKINKLVDSLATVSGRDATKDQVAYNIYDAAGRVGATLTVVDASSTSYAVAITRLYYNDSRLTDSVEYNWRPNIAANAPQMSLADVDALMAPTLDPVRDRRTRNFYDSDGNLVGTLDAIGYLT